MSVLRKVPFGVLISGSGTNLQALLDAAADPEFPGRVAVVISNRADAYGLERARGAGAPAVVVSHKGRSRPDFEAELARILADHGAEWVALAGFMRVLTPAFLDRFPGRVLNVHPALLPAFPGVDGQGQALAYGVRIAGATVHFVDAGTDTGPVVLQGAVPVRQDDTRESLQARILAVEHRLFPRALALALAGRLRIEGRTVRLPPGESGWLWLEG